MVEMHLAAVRVEQPTNTPVVFLQETDGARRTLPIFIGTAEASAIAHALQGVVPPRPLTHDLLLNVVALLGAAIEKVVVTELRMSDDGAGTYYAELHVRTGEEVRVLSSRPSDAIALAARLSIPIFAEDDLLDEAGMVLGPDDDDEDTPPDELVTQFRQFIEGIRPEDFSQ